MVTVAVLGHRGMLGSVVTRWLAKNGVTVSTTEMRWPDSAGWVEDHDYVIDCILAPSGNGERAHALARTCHLIVPSTDAIAEDSDYAADKRLVEQAPGAVVIRSGIVDLDRQPVQAYVDWLCDPLTPLEWIEEAWAVRNEPGVHLRGRHVVDRWTVAMHVALQWDVGRPFPTEGGRRYRIVVGHGDVWIGDALREMRAWYRS